MRADGEVRGWTEKQSKFTRLNLSSKIRHKINGADCWNGQMKMDNDFFDDKTVSLDYKVKVFIHEATHRYAGTVDKSFMDTTGSTFRENQAITNPTPEDCLINADSYAWCVLHIARLNLAV